MTKVGITYEKSITRFFATISCAAPITMVNHERGINMEGKIIHKDGKVLYVFASLEVPSALEGFPDRYFIGVNLDTGKVDDIKDNYPKEINFTELTDHQQNVLIDYVRIRQALRNSVVAVSAKARSGKDYLSDRIKRNFYTKMVTVKALADPIREVRNVLFGQPQGKDRAPLIMIGQGLRKEDPNIWLKIWLSRVIDDIRNHPRKIICQDVRQPNEFSFFRSLGALTVKIEVDEEKRLNKIREIDGEAALDAKLLNDETESHVGGFDAEITVENDYTDTFVSNINKTVIIALIERGW